jgi:hypothetical protein
MENEALVAATLGFTTMEVVKLWRDAAPSLEEMRSAGAGDPAVMQRMLDANIMGAGLAVIVGGTVSHLTHSWVPLLLSLGVVSFMSLWYRQVLAADHTIMEG